MKKASFLSIIIFLLTFLPFLENVNAFYQDASNGYYRLTTGESVTLTYTGTSQANNLYFYSTDLNYNITVKDASSAITLALTSQTSNGQPVTLGTNYSVTIKNNSSTQQLYINVNNMGYSNFTPTTTTQGAFTYAGEGGGTFSQGTQTGTATIQSGNLSMSLASSTFSFPNIGLNGDIQTISTTIPSVNITDATGTGNGWQLFLQATPFTEVAPVGGFASGTSAKAFTNELYNIQPSSIVAINGSSLTGVSVSGTRQSILNTNSMLASASKGNGLGQYQVQFNNSSLQLQIFNNKPYIDTKNYPSGTTPYQSTLTWTINVAP